MGSLDSTLPGPQVRFLLFLDSLFGRCSTNSRSFHIFRVCFGRRSHYSRPSRQSPRPCFPNAHIHQLSRRSILPLTKSALRLHPNKIPFKQKKIPAIRKIASISHFTKRTAVSTDHSIESLCIFRHRWMVWVSNFFKAGAKSR